MYIGLFLRTYLYEDAFDMQMISPVLAYLAMQLFLSAIAYMIITWIGSIFVEAEIPRLGNEKLLNGLKEGVFIIEEDSSIIQFQNHAAKRFISEFSANFSISMVEERDIFEKNQKKFALVDTAAIFNHDTNFDYDTVAQKVHSISNYISMNEIITNHLGSKYDQGVTKVYKLRND